MRQHEVDFPGKQQIVEAVFQGRALLERKSGGIEAQVDIRTMAVVALGSRAKEADAANFGTGPKDGNYRGRRFIRQTRDERRTPAFFSAWA